MTIETVRISDKGKQQLSKLKSKTGITQWNHLCRWAFCLSLKEKSIPPVEDISANSNIEMTWATFGGEYQAVYLAILKERLKSDNIPTTEDNTRLYFKIHLHRGISYLSNLIKSNTLDLFK